MHLVNIPYHGSPIKLYQQLVKAKTLQMNPAKDFIRLSALPRFPHHVGCIKPPGFNSQAETNTTLFSANSMYLENGDFTFLTNT